MVDKKCRLQEAVVETLKGVWGLESIVFNPPNRGPYTGIVAREFKGSADDFATSGTRGVAGVSWPVFRWAGDKEDKYFARIVLSFVLSNLA